eukprot:TRINITY_DN1967_c0_g1_i1.p1 TRINITY_DN1967_c0_g1~~TRINITY_DN1967_c0_g1_i1.p1  ORF type:complete len:172 (-),score=54.49 TRINITY_DN1967_c0_g1_i1:51-566(-)
MDSAFNSRDKSDINSDTPSIDPNDINENVIIENNKNLDETNYDEEGSELINNFSNNELANSLLDITRSEFLEEKESKEGKNSMRGRKNALVEGVDFVWRTSKSGNKYKYKYQLNKMKDEQGDNNTNLNENDQNTNNNKKRKNANEGRSTNFLPFFLDSSKIWSIASLKISD